MRYGCDEGEYSVLVPLEDGCEGPRDGIPEIRPLPDDHPFSPGKPTAWPRTASGRLVVPVPFVAFRCPAGHHMTHVDWNGDQAIALTEADLRPDSPRFLYPSDAGVALDACGIPTGGDGG